jgi:hypothetical protein
MGEILGKGKIVTNGLVLSLDAADRNSYPGSGTTWRDLSGNGRNGTLVNSGFVFSTGPTFDSANGGSLDFNRNFDNRVTTTLSRSANMTLECFFKIDSFSTTQMLLFGSNGTGIDTVYLGKNSGVNNTQFFTHFGPNSNNQDASNGYNVFDGNWHHMSFSSNNGTGSLYLDNVLRNTQNYGATSRTDVIFIGAAPFPDNSVGYYYDGFIANVRIYNRALSASEILQNYNATKSRFGL